MTPEDVESIIEALQDEYRDDGIDFIGRLPKNFIKKSLRRLGGRLHSLWHPSTIEELHWAIQNKPGHRSYIKIEEMVTNQMIRFAHDSEQQLDIDSFLMDWMNEEDEEEEDEEEEEKDEEKEEDEDGPLLSFGRSFGRSIQHNGEEVWDVGESPEIGLLR